MKHVPILIFSTLLTAGAAYAQGDAKLPVETIDSQMVQLQGVSAERTTSQVRAHGWVRRKLGAFGAITEHLHIEGLDAKGSTIEQIETAWQGQLGTRTKSAKTFRAEFDSANGNRIERVRVSVQPGRNHEEKQ